VLSFGISSHFGILHREKSGNRGSYPEEVLSVEKKPVRNPHDFARKILLVDNAAKQSAFFCLLGKPEGSFFINFLHTLK
jgi:hypothetical protein